MVSSSTPMSEPNAVPVLPPLSLDIPAPLTESVSGSTAQPTPTNASVPLPPTMPQVSLTFLMISGRRRTMSFDPSTPISRVKELVWTSWPPEWSDERPPAPSYLRILYLGKMLQDEDVLESIHNPLSPSGPGFSPLSPSATAALSSAASALPAQPLSTIVHLSIRPVPPQGEADDLKKKKKRAVRGPSSSSEAQEDTEGGGCCGGCIIC